MSNANATNVVSSQTAESIFIRETRSGMWSGGGKWHLWMTVASADRATPYAVGVDGSDYDKARKFATVADALAAFPALRAWCEKEAAIPTWQDHLRAAIVAASKKCGCGISGLTWEHATLENTWGDLVGLVFYGASDDVNKRAAEFFVAWAAKHGATFGLFGGYERQRALRTEGERHYARFSNRAEGWYREPAKQGTYEGAPQLVETRIGYSAAYVYYPCAD